MVEADHSTMESEPDVQRELESIMEELIDELSLGLCFEVHRACKTGAFMLEFTDPADEKEYALVDRPGVDVLGTAPTKKNFECVCPSCHRHLAASRFAPHLEKCMGMGRNSSRIASRRIANNTKQDSDDSAGDNENDNDWSYGTENKRIRRIKKDKGANSPRNKKAGRMRNGIATAGSQGASNGPQSSQESVDLAPEAAMPIPNYDTMTIEDRKALLLSTCGVISEHTKKMCTRSVRCPQHSDEQRRQVRHFLLRQNRPTQDVEDVHIDIDTYDDAETRSLRESLQWEASSNSSPADSTSTNNSEYQLPPQPRPCLGKKRKNVHVAPVPLSKKVCPSKKGNEPVTPSPALSHLSRTDGLLSTVSAMSSTAPKGQFMLIPVSFPSQSSSSSPHSSAQAAGRSSLVISGSTIYRVSVASLASGINAPSRTVSSSSPASSSVRLASSPFQLSQNPPPHPHPAPATVCAIPSPASAVSSPTSAITSPAFHSQPSPHHPPPSPLTRASPHTPASPNPQAVVTRLTTDGGGIKMFIGNVRR